MSDPKAVVRRLIDEVWSQGRIDVIAELVADEYTVAHDPGDPWDGKTLDRAGYTERVVKSRAPFPDQRFEVVDLVGEGDRVAASWRWTGTHAGDLPGFPASGRRIAMSGLTIYTLASGRVSRHWQVVDRLGVYQQLRG